MRSTLTTLLLSALILSADGRKSGLDLSTLDRTVRPQDDLYRFANGGWLDRTGIPPDRVSYGTFIELADRADQDVRRIIERLDGRLTPDQQRVRALYASMMNEERIEALGAEPIRGELRRIDAIDSAKDLARQAGRLSSLGAGGPFGASAGIDARNPQALIVTVTQGGTLLPERDYYLNPGPAFAAIREQYVAYLARILTLAGRPRAAADAAAILGLETALARAQESGSQARARASARAFKLSELRRQMPGFDWLEWARPQGLELAAQIILDQPEFFRSFAAQIDETPLPVWKAWLATRYITATSIYISRSFADARFEFFGRALSGQEAPRERWKRGVSMVNACLGDAVGQLYVRERFPESSRRRVRKIVDEIVGAFRQGVDEAAWMTPEARRHARAKLDTLQANVGYPDRWRSYSGLQIRPDDLAGNALRSREFENAYEMTRLQRPDEPRQWRVAPQIANAYYTPSLNEIILPAAMLQPPMFDAEAEDAVNYGGIGAIIGHEIVHAFDQRGRRFDAFGRARDWWGPKDEEQFHQRSSALVEQFNRYSPLPGASVNGELTLIENIGDLGGLSVAVRAYQRSLGGRPAPTIDGFTGEQRLLIRWAQIWRTRTREEFLRQTLPVSPHAPPQFRANGPLGHLAVFYDAFHVRPGDGLYLDAKKRVRLW